MSKIARLFPDKEIVATLSQQLTWSHFVELSTVDDSLKRDFYAEMAVADGGDEYLKPRNVGLVLFNDQPQDFFLYAQIEVVYFPEGVGGTHSRRTRGLFSYQRWLKQ